MKLLRILTVLTALVAPSLAFAAAVPLISGPQDVSQLNNTLNNLILSINNILTPLTGGGPSNPAVVNNVSLSGGTAGNPAVIGLTSTSGTNVGIQIKPNGTGNIILFGSTGSPGVLQFANSASYVTANGLTACPGRGKVTTDVYGVSGVVNGYFLTEDWLGRVHGVPAC